MDKTNTMDSSCIHDDDITAILEKEYNFSLNNLNPLHALQSATLRTTPEEGLNKEIEERKLKGHINNAVDSKITKQNGKQSNPGVKPKSNMNISISNKSNTNSNDQTAINTESNQSTMLKKHTQYVNGVPNKINGNITEFKSKKNKTKNSKLKIHENAMDSQNNQKKASRKHDLAISEDTNEINGNITEFKSKKNKTKNSKLKIHENAIDSPNNQKKPSRKHDPAISEDTNEINGDKMEFKGKKSKKNKYKHNENAIDFESKQSRNHIRHNVVVNGEINEINRNIMEFESGKIKKKHKHKQTDKTNGNASPPPKKVKFENQDINQIYESEVEFEARQSKRTKRKREEINGQSKKIELTNEEINELGSQQMFFTPVAKMSQDQLKTEKSFTEEKLKKLARVTSGKWFNQAQQLKVTYRLRLRIIKKFLDPDQYVSPILNLAKIKEKAKLEKSKPSLTNPVEQSVARETLKDLIKARRILHSKLRELEKNIRNDTRPENVQKHKLKIKSGLKTLDNRINKLKKKAASNEDKEVTAEKLLDMVNDIKSPPNYTEPLYNQQGKLIYSKFDLANPLEDPLTTNKKKDLKASLQRVLEEREEINRLKSEGKIDKAIEQLDNSLWQNSMKRIAGEKVKDNPAKLKESIKRIEKAKKKSAMEWSQRHQIVTNKQRQLQEKRKKNLAFRKQKRDAKKKKKQKSRVPSAVPGF